MPSGQRWSRCCRTGSVPSPRSPPTPGPGPALLLGGSWSDWSPGPRGSTLRARRDEWIAAGVFDHLKAEAMVAFDREEGVAERPGVLDRPEAAVELGEVLRGLEVGLAVGVVVRHVGPAGCGRRPSRPAAGRRAWRSSSRPDRRGGSRGRRRCGRSCRPRKASASSADSAGATSQPGTERLKMSITAYSS
jgi:hypothetical protein